MENSFEALYMAFAVFIFIIAITLTFSVFTQARATGDLVFSITDNQQYYESLEGITYAVASDREVGLETVIPTIYRYSKEGYGVTIVDKSGKIIARYDVESESMINSWKQLEQDGDSKYYDYINYLRTTIGYEFENATDYYISTRFKELYPIDHSNIEYGAPWAGIQTHIVRRINADISGKTISFQPTSYTGYDKKIYTGVTIGAKRGLVNIFGNSTFTEVIKKLEIDADTKRIVSGEDSVVLSSITTKYEIIYVEK